MSLIIRNMQKSSPVIPPRKLYFHSLQLKVTVGVLLTLAAALGLASYLHMHILEKRRLKIIENETAVLANSLEGALELAMLGQRHHDLQIMLQRVARDPEVLKIFILNSRGEVKLSSDSSMLDQRYRPGEGKCVYCHIEGGRKVTPAMAAYKQKERSFWSALPIYNQPRCQSCHGDQKSVNGILVVERSLAGFIAEIAQEKRQLAKLSLGGFAAAALILIPLLNIIVVSRLRHLARQASHIRAEDLEHPLTIRGRDEVADLGSTLENMRVRLRTSLREIQASKEYLEELMDSVHEGMLVVDRNLRVKKINRSWCEFTGKSADQILGKPCWQFCSGQGAPPCDCPALFCFQKGQEGWAMHTVTDARGCVRHLEVHCSPLKNQQGEIIEVVEVTRDISRRKELESQLLHAERLSSVGRLAAGIAHEINNPMASIAASAEGLQRRFSRGGKGKSPPSAEEIDEYLDTIRKASRRCREITSKLLNFARKDAVPQDLVEINRLVEDATLLVRGSIGDKCRIITELDPRLPLIKGASGELTQLVFNLILNAADALENGGEIQVKTTREETGIRLEVRDTGPGIPESDLVHIFDPFYTTKPPGVGSGLGLFVCKGIVDRHGGDIRLVNRSEGGIAAIVRLPFAAEVK